MLSETCKKGYLAILKEELIQATGCTEPIAIAYCAAVLRKVLGALPEEVTAEVSGNIIKNVKSVVVPNTDGLKGLTIAVAAGLVAGRAEKQLQVISQVSEAEKAQIAEYVENTPIAIRCADTPCILDIALRGRAGTDSAYVRIANNHTNVARVERNGEVLLDKPVTASAEENLQDKSILNIHDIVLFADEVDTALLQPLLDPQIQCNSAIAEEGLRNSYGACIGSIMLDAYGRDNVKVEAAAYAAAGSDARMSGCELPVVILSGSGNQGITASLPVIRYARHLGSTQEELYRALALSDLVAIQQKAGIGRLSAYCGAISAGVGAGAGIAYLLGGREHAIAHTVSNAIAILSGTICDGAKPSCAAKIASAVNAGILGYEMYRHQTEFLRGEGIVASHVDSTISNVGRLAREGMKETDKVILQIMTGC